jgi:hypothetical protein
MCGTVDCNELNCMQTVEQFSDVCWNVSSLVKADAKKKGVQKAKVQIRKQQQTENFNEKRGYLQNSQIMFLVNRTAKIANRIA